MKSAPAILVQALGAVARRCPHAWSLAAGRRMGGLMSRVVRSRRRRVLANLELALSQSLTPAQRHQIMRQVFQIFGQTLVETLMLPKMVRQGLDRYVQIEGWEHLEKAVQAGRGAIVFTGHFGNWEMVALAQGARGIPMDVVGRPPADAHLAQHLSVTRTLTGNRDISKYEAARPMLRSLREGRTVGLVIDQNVGGDHGIFVPFFGRPASTTPALAILALKTGAPLVPVFDYPKDGRHHIIYDPPLEDMPRGRGRADIHALTARVTSIIEEKVRRRPDLWLWMHNRWRSRPPGETTNPDETSQPTEPK
ncbi:MAG: lysophospholipid acyltransferase family protein [Acidobacteria bacterium]|nr:lysophospholipid acyltransferase family protein [Acidobacteriota bacterium]